MGGSRIGGLIGSVLNRCGGVYEGTVCRSYSTGSVTGSFDVGGLVGRNNGSDISNCYSTVSVTGTGEVGGLVGYNPNEQGLISNCYSAGPVTGDSYTGGLVGLNQYADENVLDSFWDVNSSGLEVSDGGLGLTTEQMQSKGTYMFWGCESVWTINDSNDYPRLLWEGKVGEVIDLGCGTEDEPYLIYESAPMQMIGTNEDRLDKHYKLMSDIDLSGYTGDSFNIIGKYVYDGDERNRPFVGIFDGNGHTISNFTYDSYNSDGVGLFAFVDATSAEIKNLGLIGPNVSGFYLGSLVGCLASGAITDCYVEGGSVTGISAVGGLVGRNYYADIKSSYFSGSVTGEVGVGGLVGLNEYGDIQGCYSTGGVTGENLVGGLVGLNEGGNIQGCYSTVSVTGEGDVGGLVGYDSGGVYVASFWDSDVNPDVNGIGNGSDPNVVGLPTVLMQTESTFTDAGWDFVGEVINGTEDIWDICEGTNYPKFVWQIPMGDFICPDGVNFLDFAVLGDAWFSEANMGNWDPACDISEPNDNVIDGLDLGVFAENWLKGTD